MELVFSGFSQHFVREGERFVPHIYDGDGALPAGFNVGVHCLDASEHSTLRWEIDNDYPLVLWELDFGLTEALVADEPRYLALELAVDHFSKTVWPQLSNQTFGVALYRGPFVQALIEPLKWLASHLPEEVRPFVFFDTKAIPDAATYFRLLNQADLGFLTPILKGEWAEKYPYAIPALAWDHSNSPLGFVSNTLFTPLAEKTLDTAVLLPKTGAFPIPETVFRMIPEQILTHEWEGVDHLIVTPSSVSAKCRRKLLGFEAAGGEVIDSPSV